MLTCDMKTNVIRRPKPERDRLIREARVNGMSFRKISAQFGVSVATVYAVLRKDRVVAMHCYTFLFNYRAQVRIEDGPMDTKFSHWETRTDGGAAIVVPEKNAFWAKQAEAYVSRQADYDPEFKITARGEHAISAILSAQTRL